MDRQCKIRIQIADGAIQDAKTVWGFHLIESDETIIPPVRDYETIKFPESAAEEIYPYTVFEPFDYTCTLLCIGALTTINSTVKNFYDSLFTVTSGVDLRQAKVITLYNDYKGVKVSGYVKTAEGQDYYPELIKADTGAYLFDFVLHVADPKTLTNL
ncbi:hypothetical protein EOM57_04920 [Candidatus Saccharibacteria bacterium]|nr:hypothetical protein [Candidatus Saccharibacteria bacterium]